MPGRIICLLAIAANVATADLITVDGLNADSDTGQLEGTPGGNGAGGVLEILSVTPPTGMLAITSLYRLSNVDIDGDGTFGESFDFALTFDQPTTDGTTASTIDFRDTRETFGIGTNEEFDPGESFRMSGLVLSDTSASHNVLFDGFTGIDFVSLSGLITYDGGSFTAAAGNHQGLALSPWQQSL